MCANCAYTRVAHTRVCTYVQPYIYVIYNMYSRTCIYLHSYSYVGICIYVHKFLYNFFVKHIPFAFSQILEHVHTYATLFSSWCVSWWQVGAGPPDCSKEENVAGHGQWGRWGLGVTVLFRQTLAPCGPVSWPWP